MRQINLMVQTALLQLDISARGAVSMLRNNFQQFKELLEWSVFYKVSLDFNGIARYQ